MLQRPYSFLVVFLLMFSGEILGQDVFVPKQFGNTSTKTILGSKRFKQNATMNYCVSVPCECIKTPEKFSIHDFISKNYFDDKLGFFCKKEIQLEKLISFAIRFRLGSLDYVNWMEGKPNAVKPN